MMDLFKGKGFEPREGEINIDGVFCCGECKTPVQRHIDGIGTVRVRCRCAEIEAEKKAEAERKAKAEERRAKAFGCTVEKPSRRFGFTFANDDGRNPETTAVLKAYCANFAAHKEAGEGFVLQSVQNGSGKTFLACAVANDLIDRGYSVCVTDFLTLRDKLYNPQSFKYNDKIAFLRSLTAHDLIVIDDLGAEKSSEFMLEVEYRIIDYLTDMKIPLILTTNYTVPELLNETDIDKRRVFDRIFGSCAVLAVNQPNGKSRRIEKCAEITKKLTAEGAENR